MRMYGNKRITPVYGDYRPRERRWNNIKIHGYHDEERSGDGPHEWNDTYNDRVGGTVYGQSELQAEYYASEGDSEQIQTVQGKNLFDMSKSNRYYDPVKNCLTATAYYQNTSTKFSLFCPTLKVGDIVTLSGITTGNPIIYFGSPVAYVWGFGNTITITQEMLDSNIYIYTLQSVDPTPADIYIQVVRGDTISSSTEYEPFVPNSPSPDYPSPITPYLIAGTYKITMPDGTYEVTLPTDMHGVGGVRDRVVFDRRGKVGWMDVRAAKKAFDGAEAGWSKYVSVDNHYQIIVNDNYFSLTDNFIISSHFKAHKNPGTYSSSLDYAVMSVDGSRLRFKHISISSLEEWSAFVAAQHAASTPLTVVYQRATPLRIPITFTKVISSTAPELPREFLADASSVSPDLPATIESAQPAVESRGRNLFDFNNTFGNGSGTIKLSNGYRVTLSNDWSTGWFDVIGLLPNTQYRLRGNIYQRGTLTSAAYSIRPRETPSTIIVTGTTTLQSAILTPLFTTPASGNIRVYMYSNITATAMDSSCDFTDIIISLGTDVIPYTPYREPSSVMLPPLRGIPLPESATEWTYTDADGVKWWADTARYVGGGWWDVVRRYTIYVITGAEPLWYKYTSNTTQNVYYANVFTGCALNFKSSICTHFRNVSSAWQAISGKYGDYSDHTDAANRKYFNMGDECPTVDDFKAYLAAQYAAGTPVTVLYQLATPTTERAHLGTLKSYPRYTHVEQITDGVRAHMQLTAKVVDR